MVEGTDAVAAGVLPIRQVGSQDTITHHVEERPNAVPAFVVEPDLNTAQYSFFLWV